MHSLSKSFDPFSQCRSGMEIMAVEGGTVSHYFILVIPKYIDSMSFFRHSMCFSFSFKQPGIIYEV